MLWVGFLVGAGVSERMLTPRRRNGSPDIGRLTDQVMISSTLLATVGPPILSGVVPHSASFAWVACGVVLSAVGLILRAAAMESLGNRYQLTPMRMPDEPYVCEHGPYAVIRHPGYAGLLMAFTGCALLFGQPLSLVFMLPMAAGCLVRVSVEERSLLSEFGTAYAVYRRRVPWRLIPFVV